MIFGKVNSYHDYCIKEIGKGLIISAKSDDNTIEAIEHKHLKILLICGILKGKTISKKPARFNQIFFIND